MTFLQRLLSSVNSAKSIAIFTHKNSDHDCICSGLALQQIIKQLGKDSVVFVEKEPSAGIMKVVGKRDFEVSSTKIFDVGICVDCAEVTMLCEENMKVFLNCKTKFNIDHHQDNKKYADYNYVCGGMSSCCEVLYWLFRSKMKLDYDLAKLLYSGIYMDCGAFTFSSVDCKTHKCAAELMKYCPDVNKNFYLCFGVAGEENFNITKRAFDSVRFYENGQIAVSILRKKDFEEFASKRSDGKFMSSYLQNVRGVKIAINISEDGVNEWRVSLRTACDNVNVSNIAHRFNGGGHKQASGLTLKGELEKALNALVLESKKELNKWMGFFVWTKNLGWAVLRRFGN